MATFVVICLLSGQTHKKDSIHRQYLLAKFCGLHVLLGKSCAKPVPRIWGSYKSGLRQRAGRGWTLDQAKAPVVKNRKKHVVSPSWCPIWHSRRRGVRYRSLQHSSVDQYLRPVLSRLWSNNQRSLMVNIDNSNVIVIFICERHTEECWKSSIGNRLHIKKVG